MKAHRQPPLFYGNSLSDYFEQRTEQMYAEVSAYNPDKLLNTSTESLAAYFIDKYDIEPLRLLVEQAAVDQQEVQMDVSQDENRFFLDRSEPFYVTGTVFTLYVPFEGDAHLFEQQPSSFTTSFPRGTISGSVLELSIMPSVPNAVLVQQELDYKLSQVRRYVDWVNADVLRFKERLARHVTERITQRRQKLLNDRNLAASLSYPLRPRPDAPTTYAAPEVRRKAVPAPPPASTAPFAPEPALDTADYEAILQIIQRTATMLERSPARFRQLDEEGLRDQFLVPLNSHFVGQATGETFNVHGKTDILVRSGDKTIFIAECKIWHGAKALSGAVDQLLGYTSWRDTKTAILLFNRGKELSKVLDQIPALLEQHPQFKRMLPYASETGFRCVVANRDDPNREITLTVLAFDVPV